MASTAPGFPASSPPTSLGGAYTLPALRWLQFPRPPSLSSLSLLPCISLSLEQPFSTVHMAVHCKYPCCWEASIDPQRRPILHTYITLGSFYDCIYPFYHDCFWTFIPSLPGYEHLPHSNGIYHRDKDIVGMQHSLCKRKMTDYLICRENTHPSSCRPFESHSPWKLSASFNDNGITPSIFGSRLSELSGECSLNYVKRGQENHHSEQTWDQERITGQVIQFGRKREVKYVKGHVTMNVGDWHKLAWRHSWRKDLKKYFGQRPYYRRTPTSLSGDYFGRQY